MGRRPIVAAVSVCVHALVLFALMTADLWRPISEWPTPRSALAFVEEIPRQVVIDDRAPRPRPSAHPAGGATSRDVMQRIELAPVEPPSTIGTGPECDA